MLLTLPLKEIVVATPRARIVRFDLNVQDFDYLPGQSVMVGVPGAATRPSPIAAPPEETRRSGWIELLVGVA